MTAAPQLRPALPQVDEERFHPVLREADECDAAEFHRPVCHRRARWWVSGTFWHVCAECALAMQEER